MLKSDGSELSCFKELLYCFFFFLCVLGFLRVGENKLKEWFLNFKETMLYKTLGVSSSRHVDISKHVRGTLTFLLTAVELFLLYINWFKYCDLQILTS